MLSSGNIGQGSILPVIQDVGEFAGVGGLSSCYKDTICPPPWVVMVEGDLQRLKIGAILPTIPGNPYHTPRSPSTTPCLTCLL